MVRTYTKPVDPKGSRNTPYAKTLGTTILPYHRMDSRRAQRCVQTACRMDLFTKAAELGIQAEFHDGQGQRHTTSAAALKIILDAMPIRARHWLLGGSVVLRSGQEGRTELADGARFPVRWQVFAADGALVLQGTAGRGAIEWPATMAIGAYRLDITDADGMTERTALNVAPPSAFRGEFDRSWLLAVQLYGVRSERNWGIGDFTDLENLIELAAGLGAAGIGLNPLHALFDDRPSDCSPYSPNSRLFLNPLYIDVEKVPGHVKIKDDLTGLRSGDIVDYAAVAARKWAALRSAHARFRADAKSRQRAAFEAFRADRAPLLSRFACFEVLRHKFKTPWWEWPDEWRQPDDARFAELREGPHAPDVEFVEYAQWCADDQLRGCRDRAEQLGMGVGLYLDIAVGVQSDGFDAWNEQIAISRHLSVGAPPDQLNSAGQNWGLAGFNASGLEMQSFGPFRQMLRASMRYAGAVRLDHVLGLQRLYLVPHGFTPDHGVYVQMPFDALLAVTAQESIASRCVVIGEDLGTVPDGFRERLAEWGIWSYRVMMFERDYHQGWFFGLDHYRSDALVTFNTHDLATYRGWRTLSDLQSKRAIGIDPGESDDARRHALAMLRDVLRHNGITHDDIYAVLTFMARTRSRLLVVSLEDLLGVADQPNIPGTVDENPNWRRRLPVAIEAIDASIDIDALRAATAARSIQV